MRGVPRVSSSHPKCDGFHPEAQECSRRPIRGDARSRARMTGIEASGQSRVDRCARYVSGQSLRIERFAVIRPLVLPWASTISRTVPQDDAR